MAAACRWWDTSHSISGREVEVETLVESLACIMSTMGLQVPRDYWFYWEK